MKKLVVLYPAGKRNTVTLRRVVAAVMDAASGMEVKVLADGGVAFYAHSYDV